MNKDLEKILRFLNVKITARCLLYVLILVLLPGCGLSALKKDRSLAGGLAVDSRIIVMESYKSEEVEILSGLYFPVLEDENTVLYQSFKGQIFIYIGDIIPSGLYALNGGLSVNEKDGKIIFGYWYSQGKLVRKRDFPKGVEFIFTGQIPKGNLKVIKQQTFGLKCQKFLRMISREPDYAALWLENKTALKEINLDPQKGCVYF